MSEITRIAKLSIITTAIMVLAMGSPGFAKDEKDHKEQKSLWRF